MTGRILPRVIRAMHAPGYIGMDRNRFNDEVRPHLTEIPIGKQGIGFDRLELDAWVDEYKRRNGRPGKGATSWDARESPASSCGPASGTSRICGKRICQSTGAPELKEAERYLARMMEQSRQAQVYGVRPTRTFDQAAAQFVLENQHKRSIKDDVCRLKDLLPFIGSVPLTAFIRVRCSPG